MNRNNFVSRKNIFLSMMLLLSMHSFAIGGGRKKIPTGQKPLDIVFCVDLSGSTNGLINDLRDNLWTIINQAQHMDPQPDLRIGVIGFSRPSFGRENAYVKILSPLTNNFDYIQMGLYKLRPSIEKGDQIVSEALRTAVNVIKWSDREDAVKMIYLVGNGMVTTNGYEYVKYCEQAREKNIFIHALYVMKSANWFKELPGYRRIAGLTNGMQTEISINKHDDVKIWKTFPENAERLNNKFNTTFLWSGGDSSSCRCAMSASDSGAFAAWSDVFYSRLYYKTGNSFQYSYRHCDAIANNAVTASNNSADSINSYQTRLRELLQIREALRNQIHNQFSPLDLDHIQSLYTTGQLPDDNILHRAVLNILYRYWGMR